MIPNVLTVRLSWNSVPQAWKPSLFADISRTLEDRVRALQCYADEWARTGDLWERYMRSTATLYGLEAGCDAAEGFESGQGSALGASRQDDFTGAGLHETTPRGTVAGRAIGFAICIPPSRPYPSFAMVCTVEPLCVPKT
jgi:hypothetical protein